MKVIEKVHGQVLSGIVIIITCVSGSKVNSFSRASLLILDSISLAVYWK